MIMVQCFPFNNPVVVMPLSPPYLSYILLYSLYLCHVLCNYCIYVGTIISRTHFIVLIMLSTVYYFASTVLPFAHDQASAAAKTSRASFTAYHKSSTLPFLPRPNAPARFYHFCRCRLNRRILLKREKISVHFSLVRCTAQKPSSAKLL